MPVLNPAIEQLLHHVHESGELQRALREKAAEEKALQQQRDRKQSNPQAPGTAETGGNGGQHQSDGVDGAQAGEESPGTPRTKKAGGNGGEAANRSPRPAGQQHAPVPSAPTEAKPYLHRRRTSRTGKDLGVKHEKDEEHAKTPTAAEQAEAAVRDEQERFDPLLWLSERLREAAAGPTDRYRQQVEKLVQEQIKTEAATGGHEDGAADEDVAANEDPAQGGRQTSA